MTSRGWLLWSTVGPVAVAAALSSESVRAQRGFGFGPPDREKRSVVGQFDADRNGRLNDAERAEARAWLATPSQRGAGPGRRGFGPPPEFAGHFDGQPPFFPPSGRGGRGFAMATPGPRVSLFDVTSAGSAPLYDPETVRTIFIDFPATDWERATSSRARRACAGRFRARQADAEGSSILATASTPTGGSTRSRRRTARSPGRRSSASKYRALIAKDVLADTKKLYTSDAFEAASGSGDESVKAFADGRRAFLLGEK